MSTKSLEAKCFCGAVHFTVDIPVSNLPLPVHLCHCSMCRQRSGAPCVFHTHIPNEYAFRYMASSQEENIAMYDMGEAALSSWHFCATCGCHVGSRLNSDRSWVISTSIFLDHGSDNFYVKKHIYSHSTRDGGVACMSSNVAGRHVEDWKSTDDQPDAEPVESGLEVDEHGTERLRAKCHCGGVSFTIRRPTPEQADGDSSVKRFVSPLDKGKWLATLDVCNDCRLINGTHVAGWAFLPLAICEPRIERDLSIGTAKTFSTSRGVLRSFCGDCGATVFFTCSDSSRGQGEEFVVDVATGILRAPEGSMALDWLTWRSRISHIDSGEQYDQALAQALAQGSRERVIERYGHDLDFKIG